MVSSSFQLYARALLIEFETRHCIVKSFANFRSERLVLFARVKWENSWCWRLQYLRNDNNYRDVGCHRFVAWLLPLAKVKTKLEYLLPFRRYSTGSQSPEHVISLFLFLFFFLLAVRIHSYGCWFRSLEQVSIPKFWCWRLHISKTIRTTETSFAPFGSATIALGHSENRTRISPTVSEIFDRKNSQEREYFFIMPCELVRRHIRTCSSIFDVKMEKSWCWRLQLSQKR